MTNGQMREYLDFINTAAQVIRPPSGTITMAELALNPPISPAPSSDDTLKLWDQLAARPTINRPPEPIHVFLDPSKWQKAGDTTPEKRFPTYEDGLNSERLRILAAVMDLEPRKTSIQRGAAECWKAEGARELYERVLAAIGGEG